MKPKPSQVGRNASKKAASSQSQSRPRASAAQFHSKEFKLVSLRECPFRDGNPILETPARAADYWRQHISTEARFNPHAESLVLLMLNARRRLIGHVVLSQGTKNALLINNGDVLRTAVIAGADAVVLMHNHPSGDPSPSANDIKATQELRRAGALLQIEVCDHVIIGKPSVESAMDFASLKERGYFGPLKDDETAAENTSATPDAGAQPREAQPAANATGGKSLLQLEEPIYISAGLVSLLGKGLAGALAINQPITSTRNLAGSGLQSFADVLAEDVHRSWEKVHDAAHEGRNERETCEQLRRHLMEAAGFSHSACHALANHAACLGDVRWREIGEAYEALAARAFRFLNMYHKDVPVHPYRPELLAVVKPEVAP